MLENKGRFIPFALKIRLEWNACNGTGFSWGRLPFARKIRLEWNTCNGTGFSWLTLNRSAGPR